MANKKPSNGFNKDRKRASLAGKKSSTALPPDLKKARMENAKEIEAIMYKYMNASPDELKRIFDDKATPTKDMIVISILIEAIKNADDKRFEFILNRTIGKVVEKIDHTVEAKPSVMVRRDGTEYVFSNKPKGEE
jgi:hypothetical protein